MTSKQNKQPVSVSTLVRNAKYWAQKRDEYIREAERAISAGLETQAEVLYLDAEACNAESKHAVQAIASMGN